MTALWDFVKAHANKIVVGGILSAVAAALTGATTWSAAGMIVVSLLVPAFHPKK